MESLAGKYFWVSFLRDLFYLLLGFGSGGGCWFFSLLKPSLPPNINLDSWLDIFGLIFGDLLHILAWIVLEDYMIRGRISREGQGLLQRFFLIKSLFTCHRTRLFLQVVKVN